MGTIALSNTSVSSPGRSPWRWDLTGAGLALAVATCVLLGWALEFRPLRALFPQFIDMKLSTAVGIAALAVAVVCCARRSSRIAAWWGAALAAFVLLIGLTTLVEYAVGPELLITDWTYKGGRLFLEFKERLAPITAVAFCFAGAGLLLLRSPRWVPLAQVLIVLTGEIGLVTITAYLYGASSFYGEVPEHQMALTTAIGLIGAAVGGLFLKPDQGLVEAFLSRDAGGHMARQLLPAAIILPIVLGWVELQAESAGIFNAHTATALYALSMITILALLIYRSAGHLSLSDRKRREAERQLRRHQQQLETEVQERTAELRSTILQLEAEADDRRRAEDQGRKLEYQMRQMQKMEAIGTLAGGIAHDFNNILAAILGYGEMVRSALPAGSAVRENQDEVLTAAKRATELVKQILTFSRHNLVSPVAVSVKSIVNEVVKLMRASLPSSVEIRARINAEQTTVLADPIQLHQVLMNLCTNAGHAMSQLGGVLELRLRPYEVEPGMDDSLKPGKYLLVSVSDTGVGIPQEHLDRIFEPFFTTKDVGEGTGLGLSTAHGIVGDLGGRISVYSELGEGTTFHIYLPLVNAAVQADIPIETLRGTERILFVDDEEPLARMGKLLLEEYGYTVETYSNSLDALRAFSADPRRYDLVVTDQTMPRLKGVEFAARIAQISPDTPVILCTGFGLQERSTTVEAIREVLIKPVDRAELTQAIRRTLAAAH